MKRIKFLIIISIILVSSCKAQLKKINGVSFVASREQINEKHVKPLIDIHANYAAVMPFGFIRNLEHPDIVFNTDRQWFGETREGAKQYIETLKKKHIKIMLKPQIWVWHGEFTGNIKMQSEANWKILEDSYTRFILEFAALAGQTNADIFCIGTELETFVNNRPEYWFDLINKIKLVYHGKLTYAANWNEFNSTPFWNELDYVGIDAYFPVSTSKTPTLEECLKGWKSHKNDIIQTYKTYNKPILFTEYGYRSVDYSGKQPWESNRDMDQVNLEAQNNTTQALFETFWDEDWFAGGFVWKWFINHDEVGGEQNFMFTPQNKPAEAIIKTYYETHK
ncbi:glycoside hydrolase family 113 [Siansivirga zeaxanthinifaciens]|uniref:Glycoside hydrolase n=1 Tax=Siansivirga zeaxanthinifaciens CC-SAMT-1 TaxID=1454006 RepID=A0A0C5WIL8_9FLAO|nr:glycoside hydrolase [Siansivirga zeaxanthinifaciens]AJR02545.1 glycoside hydrolase [Siansivirga zeaxanthinifaciens CC-SAMT-1]